MMDNALRTISYIADIGNIVVLMARRRMPRTASQDCIETTPGAPEAKKQYKMICHVFESEDVRAPSFYRYLHQEVMFLQMLICLFVCVFVNKITQNVPTQRNGQFFQYCMVF